MHLEQYYLECLAQASYLIGDDTSGMAVVVDPRRDVDLYVEEAERRGLSIQHVFLTHFHADFASGHLELRDRCGAEIHLGAAAKADYEFTPAREGDAWTFGEVRIEILETPGHTPESISLLVYDLATKPKQPHAVLTGDCLFIGDVGRPDLLSAAGISQEVLASQMFDSLHSKLLKLPDETLLYPGHGAGSMCGKNLSSETVSTIGQQRRFNYAAQPMSEDAFVRMISEGQPPAPGYFAYDAGFNKKEHPLLENVLDNVTSLSADDARALQREGAVILDVRDADAFAGGHLPGSINIGLSGRYATWVGTLVAPEVPIVVVAPEGLQGEAALRLGRIGFDRIPGVVTRLDGNDLATHVRISPEEASRRLSGADAPVVVDVRQPEEWELRRIDGSINVPLTGLQDALDQVPQDRPVLLHCRTGYRSCAAASVLARAGRAGFLELAGGIEAWEADGYPVRVTETACS